MSCLSVLGKRYVSNMGSLFLVKCRFWVFLACLFLGAGSLTAKPLQLPVQAESAILINADDGTVLFEKNARKSQDPASLTKIATAIYTLEVRGGRLDKIIAAEHDSVASISDEELRRSNYTLPSYWLVPGTSHMGIKKGEELSLKDLLYGMMLASAGDASNVIAQYVGGTIPTFMELLNEYLKGIGCQDTAFKNPHGLHHPDHRTTAYDMAILTREALKNPTFCDFVKTVQYTRPQTNKQKSTTLIQTNRLLKRGKFFYSKAIGVKTGYTSVAQSTLVAAARNKNRTLIAVLLKSSDRDEIFRDAKKLFETAFREKAIRRKLLPAGPQKATLSVKGGAKAIKTYLKKEAALEFFPAEEPVVKCLLCWDKVEVPVEKGQRVGVLNFEDQNGRVLLTEPLFASEKVGYSWSFRLKQFLGGKVFRTIVGVILTLFLFLSLLLMLRK